MEPKHFYLSYSEMGLIITLNKELELGAGSKRAGSSGAELGRTEPGRAEQIRVKQSAAG